MASHYKTHRHNNFKIHQPPPPMHARKEFFPPLWHSVTHVYIKILQRKHKLSPLHKAPFSIIIRHDRYMTIGMDGQNKRISYLYLYPIELRDDDNSRRSENQVMLFHLFLTKKTDIVYTHPPSLCTLLGVAFSSFLSPYISIYIYNFFSTHTATLLK